MPYDNSTRAKAADANRRRALEVARESFVTEGYAATTIRSVAAASGLSQEFVYKAFGGKAGLLKAVYDLVLAGDHEPIPMAMRAHAQAVAAATTPTAAAIAWADMVVTLGERIGPLIAAVAAAGATDPSAASLLQTMHDERYAGAVMAAGHWSSLGWLRPSASLESHARTLWVLNSPQVRDLLALHPDVSETYHAWLVRILTSSVLRDVSSE